MERKKPNRSPESLARRQAYTDAWNKENTETFLIRVHKGKKQEYRDLAESRGQSLNGLVIELLERELKA